MTIECGCTRRLAFVDGCGRRSCPRCGQHKADVSGARLADRLAETISGHVQFLELTVPVDFRWTLKQPGGAGLWAGWLRAFWRILKEQGGAVWAYQRTHPCGDDGRTFHPHANWIFVQRKRMGLLDPEKLRREWAAVIGSNGEVNLFSHWADCSDWTGRAKLLHHCRYTERHFPGWAWKGLAARWYGKAPKPCKPAERSRAKGVCPCCGQRTVWSDPVGPAAALVAKVDALLLDARPLPGAILAATCEHFRERNDPLIELGRDRRIYYERLGYEPP